MKTIKLVLLRHGESVYNKANRFTGWTDVDLSARGREEAKKAGLLLQKEGFTFDQALCSVLKRAIETLEIVLRQMGLNIPIKHSWRLNERHYGALQGLNKTEIAEKYGEKQMLAWRRSYAVRPPELKKADENYSTFSLEEQGLEKKDLPLAESLKDVQVRLLPYWNKTIAPLLKADKKVIIFAHGNSMRALVKYLDNISDKDISNLNIPYGTPLVYEFDENIKKIKSYYLASDKELAAREAEIAQQGRINK